MSLTPAVKLASDGFRHVPLRRLAAFESEIGITGATTFLLAQDGSESDEGVSPPESPTTPDNSCRRSWHRRLKIVIPGKTNPSSGPTLSSPRSPLSPIKLWSAVQRGASWLPVLRLKPKHASPAASCRPPSESPVVATPAHTTRCSLDNEIVPDESASLCDTLLTTASTRNANGTDDELVYRPYEPLTGPYDQRPSWYIPAHSPAPAPITTPAKTKAQLRPRFEDPFSYRWPEPQITPPTPPSSPIATDSLPERGELPCPDLRWYHPFLLLFLWHLFIVSLSTFVILRVVFKPLRSTFEDNFMYLLLGDLRWAVGSTEIAMARH
ncbi:hypothetical protein C8F04DRAFT_1323195 [Mycena alexandri]|uniref:Uncharacterized protein n=1 Tax=Mycena alexandri TaxID=1745969 RepID=A0AAD6TM18_9AGAR|nr:hypothetical protein C8F04DRAFT_1323195 [Mycena alexandri]